MFNKQISNNCEPSEDKISELTDVFMNTAISTLSRG